MILGLKFSTFCLLIIIAYIVGYAVGKENGKNYK